MFHILNFPSSNLLNNSLYGKIIFDAWQHFLCVESYHLIFNITFYQVIQYVCICIIYNLMNAIV